MSTQQPLIVIGGGPAGLSAAYEAARAGLNPVVLEKDGQVGGLARTEVYKGYRFDIGGHRFYTRLAAIQQVWQDMLGEDLLKVRRLSHIYYRERFFNYPLEAINTLVNLGLVESARAAASYLAARLWPYPQEETIEEWVSNRFGRRLYRMFFKTYTEKVWGMPCDQIQANWAAQRIQGLSLRTVVLHALFGNHTAKTLAGEFYYPILGSGMLWQRLQAAIERSGGQVHLNSEVTRLEWSERRMTAITTRQGQQESRLTGQHFISSMPLATLVARLDPPSPPAVLQAAQELRYRDFILVGLIVKRATVFPDQWIYIHSPEAQVGRIQNFKNWSAAMTPDAGKTSLGLEYFCSQGDALWQKSDAELIELAGRELASLKLARASEVEDGVVIRQTAAYPIYDRDYRTRLDVIRSFLATLDNLQTIGRNGMHYYNNHDHSMLTGLLAARNVLGESHDVWRINTEPIYTEEGAM